MLNILKKNFIPIIILIIIFAFIVQPNTVSDGVFRGLNIWINNIVPFLFPMFILSDILLQYSFIYSFLERFSFISNLILKSKYALIPYFISIISGYPSGALATDIMADNKKVNSCEADYIITFTNNCSLQFITAVVAYSMLGDFNLAIYIAVPHYVGALILSFLYCNQKRNINVNSSLKMRSNRFNKIFSQSVYKAIISTLTVGGVIVFFSIFSQYIINVLSSNNLFVSMNADIKDILYSLIIGSFEITNGCKLISSSAIIPLQIKLVIINFLISFSGISIIFQTIAVVSNFDLNLVEYIKKRFIFAVLSSLLCILMIIIF